jgi:hypothetical protein
MVIAPYQLNSVLKVRLKEIACIIEYISAVIVVIEFIECISDIESE